MKYRVFRATGTGAAPGGNIAETLAPVVAFQLEEIRLHLSADGGDNAFTVTLDSAAGGAYDVLILSQNTNGLTDLIYRPTRPHIFQNVGDALVFAWTNANARTWGLEVYYSAI